MPRRVAPPPVADVQVAATPGVAAVDRALSLLDAFTLVSPTLTLSELADRTRQYKSTVLRLLASLEKAHVVRRLDDGRFALGWAVARLSAVYSVSFSIADVVLPVMRSLSESTRESVALHVRQGDQDLCLYRIDSPHPVRDHARAGDLRPLARSAAGKVLLAYESAGSRNKIRQQQLLIADGNIVPELAAIAAPVFAPGGGLAGVLALTMPSTRLVDAHAAAVQEAARNITQQLGASYPSPGDIRGNPR